jgi:hypothetical protein
MNRMLKSVALCTLAMTLTGGIAVAQDHLIINVTIITTFATTSGKRANI